MFRLRVEDVVLISAILYQHPDISKMIYLLDSAT